MSDKDKIDPVQLMRDWFIQSEKMWSDAMTEFMADERVANSSGRFMQEALHTQRMFSESMGQYLSNLNIPSRNDFLDLKDRMSQIDETLNAVLIELRDLRKQAGTESTASPRKKPARTRKADQDSSSPASGQKKTASEQTEPQSSQT
ncbi:MAG: hypothetical protein OXE78_15580 [Gammaproteobacteria bacterium]|nr:hypothetical protein [Gammaproteobacteria bacterium]MCY4356120.1 hypothetical protein [Gammaproteobacteria bacterium]